MSQELETLVAELIETSPGGVAPHPAPRRILDYRAQLLDDGAAAAVREHLVLCRACAAALVDLGELEGPVTDDEAASEVTDYATAAAWRALAPNLGEASSEAGVEASRSSASSASRWWPRLAAILALGILGLGFWATQMELSRHALEDRLASLESPRANAAVVYLDARMRSEPAAPQVSRLTGRVLVFLTPPEQPAAERYRVEIRDAPGRLRAAVGGLKLQDLGALRFSLAAGTLDTGRHRVLLFADGEDEELATYHLEVVEESRTDTPKP